MKIEELEQHKKYYFLRIGLNENVYYAKIIDIVEGYFNSGSNYYDIRLRITERLSPHKIVSSGLDRCLMLDVIDKYKQFNDKNKLVIKINKYEYISEDKESLVKVINDYYYKLVKETSNYIPYLIMRKTILNKLKRL